MRALLAALAALSLIGCSTTSSTEKPSAPATMAGVVGSVIDATGEAPPAPLAQTLVDDKALVLALQSAETIATTVDALVAAKVLVPGTPRALAVQSALKRLRGFLTAASAAQRAGNATTYRAALTDAAVAVQDITKLIRGQ